MGRWFCCVTALPKGGIRGAVSIVGHDWGASVAWHAALFRPDLFPAVAAMSVPFRRRGPAAPLGMLRKAGLLNHYWFGLQEPGLAEREFERDPRGTLRRILYSISGDAPPEARGLTLQPGKSWLTNTIDPERLPSWLSDADLDHMAAEFSRIGFRGGLNWYRNIDRNWELTAPWAGASIRQPALFIAGSLDPVIDGGFGNAVVRALATTVPGLTQTLLIEGAALPVGEIIPPSEVFDYESKYQRGGAREVFLAEIAAAESALL